MSTNDRPSLSERYGRYWPYALIGLLFAGAATNIGMVIVAVNDPSFAVEHNYYQKALKWDKTMDQQRVNLRLGWQVKLSVEKGSLGKMKPVLRVLDRAGKPLATTHVELVMFHSARASRRYKSALQASQGTKGPILVGSDVPMRAGLWVYQVRVMVGATRFTTKQTLWVG